MDTEKIITGAIRDQLAKSILDGIGAEARDAIIAKSITDAMKDYTFCRVLENHIAEFAQARLDEMLKTPQWTAIIDEAIVGGFALFTAEIRQAIPRMLTEAFSGRDEAGAHYRMPGLLLKHIAEARREREKK